MLHRSWTNGDETFYLAQALNIVGSEKWKSLQQHGVEEAHAIFDYDPGRDCYWLRDLSTKAGVRVNGIPISKTEPVRLKNGDQIAFGKSPEYTFLLSSVATQPVDKLAMYQARSRSRRQYDSSDETIDNGGFNLAVDSAPSVNGASPFSNASHPLPRLNRGRSPASRRPLAQLPVATLVDGRRIDVEGHSDSTVVSNTRHSPNVMTYRQRQFLRHASIDSSASRGIGADHKRVLPAAWDDGTELKEPSGSSASSIASFTGGHRSAAQRGSINDSGAHSLHTHQSTVVRQLQRRVQQLEEALRLQQPQEQAALPDDSGVSSAASDPANNKAYEAGSQQTENGKQDDQQVAQTVQLSQTKSEPSKETMRLQAALAASERHRLELERLLASIDPSQGTPSAPDVRATHDTRTECSATACLDEEASIDATGSCPVEKMPGCDQCGVNQEEDEINNLQEKQLDRQWEQEPPSQVIKEVSNRATDNHSQVPDADADAACKWQEFLREIDDESIRKQAALPQMASLQQGAKETIKEEEDQPAGEEATEDRNVPSSLGVAQLARQWSSEKVEAELLLNQCRVEVALLLVSFFAEEIVILSGDVTTNPLYDYSRLTAYSLEYKIAAYKKRLLDVIATLRSSPDHNPFPRGDQVQLNEEFWDRLCTWAVGRCAPMVEATHQLMPTVVHLLQRGREENEAQKMLTSWMAEFTALQQSYLNAHSIRQAAEQLRMKESNHWQKNMVVSLLQFISDRVAAGSPSSAAGQRDCEANTDISHKDFSKLISDIADLLDDKERLRVTSTNLLNELNTKRNELDLMNERIGTLQRDIALLQEDNQQLTEAKRELAQRVEEFETRNTSLDEEHAKSSKETNATYRQRIEELEKENEGLKEERQKSQSTQKEELDTNEQALDTTASAREELEYLKSKIAELGVSLQNEDGTSGEQVPENYVKELEAQRERLQSEVVDLNKQLAEKDAVYSMLESKIEELERENSHFQSSGQQINEPAVTNNANGVMEVGRSQLQEEGGDSLQNDTMFWTLSQKLGDLLSMDDVGYVETGHASEGESNMRNSSRVKDPAATAQDIVHQVQQLTDRVKRQDEEIRSHRCDACCNVDKSPHRALPPPYLNLANGSAEQMANSIDRHKIAFSEEKQWRRSRSGSVKYRRRSPSPRMVSARHSTGSRECHACDVLKARRRQQELIQAAKMQTASLVNRQLDSYPLKVVTFKLPNCVSPEEEKHVSDENRENV